MYEDFLKAHGEGFHHFALDVPDIDAASRALEALAAQIVQSGYWGEKDKPGYGPLRLRRHERVGGLTIELLWSRP